MVLLLAAQMKTPGLKEAGGEYTFLRDELRSIVRRRITEQ